MAHIDLGSARALAAVTGAILLLAFLARKLATAFDNDLRRVPGPYLNRFTTFPLKLKVLTGQRMHYIHALHQQYGPVVRIGPKEVALADSESHKQIHKIGTHFSKYPGWYQGQAPHQYNDETCGVFGLVDFKKAAYRRKHFQQAGTKAAVLQWEPQIVQTVEQTVSKIKRDALAGRADVLKWWSMMTADVVGSLAFGEPFEMVEKEEKPQLIKDIEYSMLVIALRLELRPLYELISFTGAPVIGKPEALLNRIREAGRRAVLNTKMAPKGSSKTLFSKMYPEDGEQPFSDVLMAEEAANIIVAGSDTTATVLTYILYEVLRNPKVKSKLLNELATCSPSPSWEELESKPYLNCVVQESLRLHPGVQGTLPRVVPKEGATLAGLFLPGGTVVGTQAYTMHRDALAFPNPDR